MHSILILGCGSIGERHLRCFQKTKRAAVAACDTNPSLLEAMAERYGASTFTDYSAALREPFDAVVICTPAHLHVPLARTALEAGKHVLIEKPLSHSLAGVDSLVQVHASSGRHAAVAYIYRVIPVMAAASAFLKEGSLGPVLQVTLNSGQHFPAMRPPHTAPYHQTYYRDRGTGGGAIQDALTHLANWVEAIVGPTDSVLCDCAHLALPQVEVEDTVHIAARHGGTLVSYTLNQFQAPNESILQFNTALGSVRIELHRLRWGVMKLGEPGWTWHECPVPDRDTNFIVQAEAFLDQIEGLPSRLCSLADAVQTLRFNLAALASADAGGTRVQCAALLA